MKKSLRRCALLVLLLAALGFLFAWAGFVPIAASSGHWPITAWLLHFTMRQSVQTRAIGIEPPTGLGDSTRILKGARHFATGCAPCHGAPGTAPSEIAQQMTPHPPDLQPRIDGWSPGQLFWIVQHGIKFTGMPSWPTELRDDEVWAVVAFLMQLPRLTPREYGKLTGLPAAGGGERLKQLNEPLRSRVEGCARCHGVEGAGGGDGAFPRLAGQGRTYLEASLEAFASGRRHSGVMQPVAAALNEADRQEIAEYYAEISAPKRAVRQSARSRPEGRSIARHGVPGQGVPSCIHCHGPSRLPRNPFYPELAGQYFEYLLLQLELFKERRRGGTPFAAIMHEGVDRMTERQMRAVASYYSELPPMTGHKGEGALP